MASPLQRLGRRVMMALGLARQTSDTDESRSTPTMQLALAAGEMRSDVPLLQEYTIVQYNSRHISAGFPQHNGKLPVFFHAEYAV